MLQRIYLLVHLLLGIWLGRPMLNLQKWGYLLQEAWRNPLLVEFVAFAVSTFSLQVSRLGVSLVGAKFLGPATWGLWYILSLVLIYGSNVHLGVLNGMNRNVPLFKGREDHTKVARIRAASLGFLLLSSGLAALSLAGWAFFRSDLSLKQVLLHLIPLFYVTQLYLWIQLYLKSDTRFKAVSNQNALYSLILPLTVIPLTLMFELPGFLWGQTLAIAIILVLTFRAVHLPLRPALDWIEVGHLIRVGAPIMIVGLLFNVLTTLDRLIITSFLGIEQMGHYSLALMISSAINMLPMIIAEQMYPRMAEAWGSSGQIGLVMTWVRRQILYASMFSLIAAVSASLILPGLVRFVLPDYAAGLPAAFLLLLPPVFLSIGSGYANVLNTVGKQFYYLVVQALAIFVFIGLSMVFVGFGWGITGVAAAVVVTHALYAGGLVLIGERVVRQLRSR